MCNPRTIRKHNRVQDLIKSPQFWILQFFYTASILHKAAAPAVPAAIKTKLSHQNDTIIAIFFAANKNKGKNAYVALASSIPLENSGFQ